jgi:RNA polymerase sigma-70 factor, ECF subfamily
LVKNDLNSTAQRKIDAELIHRALEGNEDACAALFHAHRTKVYSLCRRMTSSPAEAEDLTQDAFLQVFCKLGTFRGDSALSTWLYRVATNTVLMHLRKKSPRHVSLEESPNQEVKAPKREHGKADDRLRTSVDRIALTRAMKELPVGYRTVFVMHEVKGYEHHEIARLLRCSVGNSKSQLHKAKARMRELLGMQKVQDGRGTAKQQSAAMGEPGTGRRRFLTGKLREALVLATSEKAAISF